MKKIILFVALTLLVQVAYCQAKLTDPIAIAPELKIGKLSNGLTYYIKKNTRPEKKVELRLVVNVGSVLEDDDQQGLAHFTEHMGFNGSSHFKKNELVSFLQTMGVKFGADLNAYTGFEETVYILPIPLDKKENLDKGLQVLEDWASTMSFENAEIDKERGVVLEESRLGKGASDRMNKIIYPKLFEGSPYASRLPIGKDEILKTFKYDAAKRFYHDWYRPDLMAVVAVGDIDPAEVEGLISKHFGKLKNPAKERKRFIAEVKPREKNEAVVVSDKEATQSVLFVYYSETKMKEETTVGDFRQSIVKSLFESMLSNRFSELTQKANPPFLYGGSSLGGIVRGYETFNSFALVGAGGPEPAIKAIVEEDERARKFGFSAAELERSKKDLMKSMERYYNERDKTESSTAVRELVNNFLVKEPIPGPAIEYSYYEQFVPGITLEEVNALAAKSIPASGNKLVVLMSPEKPEFPIPSTDQLLSMVDNAAKVNVTAYEEKAVATSLMETVPKAGKIISEKENKELGYTEINLSNGVRVLVKPTEFKNDQLLMSAFRFGGQFLYPVEDRFNAEYAATIVAQMGVGQFSPVDLGKVLAGKSASVSPRISALSEGLSGQSSATDVETLLQLTHLYFTEPRKDDELFKSFVTKQQAAVQNMMSDPQAIFRDSVLKITYKNHPRAPKLPRPANFAGLSENRVLAIYKDRFGNADGFTFIFVGKVDLAVLRPLLTSYLGSLPSVHNATPAAFKDAGVRPVKGVVKVDIHEGSAPKSFISLLYTGEAAYSDEEQLKLQALIEVLNIKIIETLREEMSGIYGGGISGSLNKNPYGNYAIGLSLPCGPENVDKLLKAALAEIEKVKASGPPEADLAKVKENWKKQYEENVKNNSYWLRQLQAVAETTSTTSDVLSYEKRVDAITVKDLKETADKYLSGKNYIQAVLYPEK